MVLLDSIMKNYIFLITVFLFSNNLFSQNTFENLDVFNLQYVQDPQISPDGSKIVYVRTKMDIMIDGRSSSLWIINTDGSNNQKLTSNNNNERTPRWSPDGSKIAFVSSSEDANGSEIYVYWLNNNQYSVISQLDNSPRGLSWSPDGNYIAFSMFVPDRVLTLVKPPAKPQNAKWAKKARITDRVKHEADGSGYMEKGFSHLFYINANGGVPKQVTKESYNHYSFDWTKDNNSLIFTSNYNEDWEYDFRNSEIYSISTDGLSFSQLTDRNGPDSNPIVSNDGTKIAYIGFDDKVQTHQVSRLYLMNIDGSDKKEISTNLDRSISSIKWAGDDSGIYFSYDNHGNTKVAFISLSGRVETLANDLGGTSIGRPYGGGSFSISKS